MLPELKTFMSIVEVNNIDKVIENLNISKATIYEHIKYLEQYFSSNIWKEWNSYNREWKIII